MNQNLQNNFLKKYSECFPNSPQWTTLEYKLQLRLGSTTPNITKIYNISNSNLISKFQKANKGKLRIDSFVEQTELKGFNKFENICQKGFYIQQQGLIFSSGYKKIELIPNKSFKLLYCRVAIGKSQCVSVKKMDRKVLSFDQDFDSIYLYNQQEHSENFCQNYIIFNNQKVLPEFLIEFEFDMKKQKSLKPSLCDDCGDNIARIYCETQQVNLCNQCDINNHKSKLTSKHKRKDIHQRPKDSGECKIHRGLKLQLFCNTCNVALCMNCKIAGDHLNGQNNQHVIVRMVDAYTSAVQKFQELEPFLEKRKAKLAEMMKSVDLKIKEINKNATVVEQQIYTSLQLLLKQLKQVSQKKMSYLIGDQFELKRQYDQIQWIQSFLKYEHQILAPNDFLKAWPCHLNYRKQILSLEKFTILTDVKADIKIQGKISVVLTQMIKFPQKIDQLNILQKEAKTKQMQNNQSSQNKAGMIHQTPFRKNVLAVNDKNSTLIKSTMLNNKNMLLQLDKKTSKQDQNKLRLSTMF